MRTQDVLLLPDDRGLSASAHTTPHPAQKPRRRVLPERKPGTMGRPWLIPGDIPPGKRKTGGCKRQTPRKRPVGFGGTKRNKLSTSSLTTDRELISFHCQFAVSLVTILSTDSRRYESVYLFCSAFAFAFCVHLWFGFCFLVLNLAVGCCFRFAVALVFALLTLWV